MPSLAFSPCFLLKSPGSPLSSFADLHQSHDALTVLWTLEFAGTPLAPTIHPAVPTPSLSAHLLPEFLRGPVHTSWHPGNSGKLNIEPPLTHSAQHTWMRPYPMGSGASKRRSPLELRHGVAEQKLSAVGVSPTLSGGGSFSHHHGYFPTRPQAGRGEWGAGNQTLLAVLHL